VIGEDPMKDFFIRLVELYTVSKKRKHR